MASVSVVSILRACGGIASASTLARHGVTRRQLDAALRASTIGRVHRGWYCIPDAASSVVRAVSAGGVLTCVSALALQGAWTMPDERVHVRIGRGRALRLGEDLRVHWSDDGVGTGFPMDGAGDALRVAISCLDRRAAVVVLDSALNRGLVTRGDAETACESPRGRRLMALSDQDAASGIETLARLALHRMRLRYRSQVPIAGVGRVDLVIGDRLVLELDGEGWHDRPGDFENDRRRDRQLIALGYLPLRASYRQVMHEWPTIEQQILTIVRRDGHLWPRRRA